MGALLIAPVLPELQRSFAGTPGVEVLAPLVMTVPALSIALLSPMAGMVVDRLGRTRLLRWSMLAYAVVGTAPLWLHSLAAILVSRVLLGVIEAAIITCCLTLIGDYFIGARRDRYLAWHSMVASSSAIVFMAVGGILGAFGWRTPFWGYAIALPLLAAMTVVLREPRKDLRGADTPVVGVSGLPRRLAPLLTLTFIGGVLLFFVLQVQLSFLLDDLGIGSAGIGAAAALANLGVTVAAMSFARAARHGANHPLIAGFAISGLGLLAMSLGDHWLTITAGAVVCGVGGGLLMPALLIGTTSQLAFELRGRGTAAWISVYSLSQFFSPVAVAGITAMVGTLDRSLLVCAMAGWLTAVIARWML
ncbi:MFS transporter [Actinoplanes siamensis]|uniref:MFS transporter n=2 Tax=Actinoplanes siamensis TaxID=1223317 RepID=A0A919ND33_9ACTN|nr:MFS transporter [Actinoplanes siamensis]